MAVFGERRPTRDVDRQAESMNNDTEVVLRLVVEIAAVEIDDGVAFRHGECTGFRHAR